MRPSLLLAPLLGLLAAGCFSPPQPNCAFLCGPSQGCPEDYRCGTDNRCHLVLSNGGLAVCETPLPPDASVGDAPEPDADVTPDADETPDADDTPDADPTADADQTPDAS